MTMHTECVVVGAGCVGLAVARALSKQPARNPILYGIGNQCLDYVRQEDKPSPNTKRSVLVVERTKSIGSVTSSRNSEVVHAGIYYEPRSFKAQLCILGQKLLYNYLQERSLPFKKCGKVIVATNDSQEKKLMSIISNGNQNGSIDLQIVDKSFVRDIEPDVFCTKAIWSPSTGIFDSHAFMTSLHGDAEAQSVDFVFDCEVESVEVTGKSGPRFIVHTSHGLVSCDYFVNAAGLTAPFVAKKIHGLNRKYIPKAFFAKGSYYKLSSVKSPFKRLVYPIPENGGLGVHATIDLSGSVRFGPDIEWLKPADLALRGHQSLSTEGNEQKNWGCDFSCATKDSSYEFFDGPPHDSIYVVDPTRADSFYSAVRSYWPDLPDDTLKPDYAGLRPKLCGPSSKSGYQDCTNTCNDFVIQGSQVHNIPGLVNLFGIESPGLTSSLAIGDYVEQLLRNE